MDKLLVNALEWAADKILSRIEREKNIDPERVLATLNKVDKIMDQIRGYLKKRWNIGA